MKTDAFNTFDPISQILINLPTKTAPQNPKSQPAKQGKLPQGAKIIGNYLLGTKLKTQANSSGKVRSVRSTWPCTSQQTKKWQ